MVLNFKDRVLKALLIKTIYRINSWDVISDKNEIDPI